MARYTSRSPGYAARGQQIESLTVPPGSVTVAGALVALCSLVHIGVGVFAFLEPQALTEWYLERPWVISNLPSLTDEELAQTIQAVKWGTSANGLVYGLLGLLFARGVFRRRRWARTWVTIGSVWTMATCLPGAIVLHTGFWVPVAVGFVVLVLIRGGDASRWFSSRGRMRR